MTRLLSWAGAALILTLAVTALFAGASKAEEPAAQNKIFEMRVYTTEEGRLDALNKRFREHTNRLFVKHGMTLVGYWTPTDGEEAKNTLIYILAFPSREAREQSFKAFREDPQWIAARDASERDGKIVKKVVSTFMQATDYSPIK